MGLHEICAKRAGLKRREPRTRAEKRNVGNGFALKHLADENEFAALVAIADAIADHSLAEHCGEFRREIADLIRVRKQNEIGLCGFDGLLERDTVSVGRVVGEKIVIDGKNFGDGFGGEFFGKSANSLAKNCCDDTAVRCSGDLLRGGKRFEAGVVPLALAMLGDDEDFHAQITLASNFSFSTSFAAISLGVPVRNSVFFVFTGT